VEARLESFAEPYAAPLWPSACSASLRALSPTSTRSLTSSTPGWQATRTRGTLRVQPVEDSSCLSPTSSSPPTSRFGSSEAKPTWERTWARSSSDASRRLGSLCEAQVASATDHLRGAAPRHLPRPPPALLEQLPADELQEPTEDACPLDFTGRYRGRCPQKYDDTREFTDARTRP
jgi:hypothetical protein